MWSTMRVQIAQLLNCTERRHGEIRMEIIRRVMNDKGCILRKRRKGMQFSLNVKKNDIVLYIFSD